MKFSAIIIIVFLLLIQLVSITSCKDSIIKKISIDEVLVELVDSIITNNENIESMSIGIIDKGEEYIIQRGFLLDGSSPNSQTQFEIASLTKTFLGTLIAKAIIENKVDLDDDIRLYLEGDYQNLEKDKVPISFRHLATHRSGLPLFFPHDEELFSGELDWNEIPFQLNKMQKGYRENQFFDELRACYLKFKPGSEVMYSNVGANLSGFILASIYNKSIDDLMQENIFKPLNMSQTFTRLSDADLALVAKGKNENGLIMPYRIEKEMNTEGGFISTLPDMMKYLHYQLDSTIVEHKLTHIDISNDQLDYHKGMFWQIGEIEGQPTYYQIGGAYGTSSKMTVLPSRDIALFIITNASGDSVQSEIEKMSLAIFEILLD